MTSLIGANGGEACACMRNEITQILAPNKMSANRRQAFPLTFERYAAFFTVPKVPKQASRAKQSALAQSSIGAGSAMEFVTLFRFRITKRARS